MLRSHYTILILVWGIVLAFVSSCAVQAGAAGTTTDTGLDRPKVAWAGLSLAGDNSKLKTLYPISYQFQERANGLLMSRLQGKSPAHYELVANNLIDISKGDSLAATLTIDNESVVVRKLAGLHQAVIEVSANVLVFDLDSEEKAVIASFPIGLGPYIETFSTGRPSVDQLNKLVEGYLFGGLSNFGDGLVEVAARSLMDLDIKYRFAAKIGMGEIEISELVKSVMQEDFNNDEALMKAYLARQSARLLSNQQNVSVMPYVADGTVSKMALRFTGQKTTLLLQLPEPDYLFNLNVENFARKLIKENNHEKLYLYAARATLNIEDDFGDQLFNESIVGFVQKKILQSQTTIDEWAVYRGSLKNLTTQFLNQLSKPDKNWLKQNKFDSTKKNQIKRNLSDVAQALEQCR